MAHKLPFSDRPLKPGEDDLLGREPFVRNLVRVLCNAPTDASIVFALYGRWGEGKTSTLSLLEKELEARSEKEESTPFLIRFNPWVFSGREQLFAAFFEDIGNAIGISGITEAEEKAKRWKRLGAYSNLVGQGLNHVDTVLNVFGASIPGWRLLGKFLEQTGDATALAAEADAAGTDRNLSKLREELEEALADLDRPFLIVLDDLDRLPPAELVEIFQLLKSVADLPKVHYLLLCDRANIERSLEVQNLRPDYLEKIVQFSAVLPAVPDSVLRELLTDQVRELFKEFAGDDDWLDEEFWTHFSDGSLPRLFSTLRDVKRYIGELRLVLPVFCENGHFELNPDHFLKLQALRLLMPEIVDEIRARRELFVPKRRRLFNFDEDLQQNENARKSFALEELPKLLKNRNRPLLESLLRDLLLSGGVDWSADSTAAEGRFLTSALWFDSYFTQDLPVEAVKMSDVIALERSLPNDSDRIPDLVHSIATQNGYAALVRCLTSRSESLTLTHGEALLTAMLSPDAPPEEEEARLFAPGVFEYFTHWVHRLPETERKERIIDLVKNSRNHKFFSSILYIAEGSDHSNGEIYKDIEPFYNALGEATAKIIEAKAKAQEPLYYDDFWQSYDVWAKWGSRGHLREWIRNQTKSSRGFKDYLMALGGFRTSHDGTGSTTDYFWINHNRLETFPSLNDGIKRCRELSAEATDDRDQMLFSEAAETFKLQAEFRRGQRVMRRQFPELPHLRFVNPEFSIGESTAVLLDRHQLAGLAAPPPQPSLKDRFETLFEIRCHYVTSIDLTSDGGHSTESGIMFSCDTKTAFEYASELGHEYILMIRTDRNVHAIGLNGEGRIRLGLLKNLVIKKG